MMEASYTLNSLFNAIAMAVLAVQCVHLYWRADKNIGLTVTLFALIFTCTNRMMVDLTNLVEGGRASSFLFIFALVRNYAMIYLMYYFTKKNKKNKWR